MSAMGCVSAGRQWASAELLLFTVGKPVCVKRPGVKGLRVARMPRGLGGTRLQRAEKRALAGHTPLTNMTALTRSVSAPAHMWVKVVGLDAGISMLHFAANALAAKPGLRNFGSLFPHPFISALSSPTRC